MSDRRVEIKKHLLLAYLEHNLDVLNQNTKMQLENRVSLLDSEPIETTTICYLIQNAIKQSTYPPKVSQILKPYYDEMAKNEAKNEQRKEREEAEFIDRKWIDFLRYCDVYYEKRPDWSVTIMRIIGENRVSNATAKELPWIKKEFIEIAKRVFAGDIELITDNRQFIKIGNTWALEAKEKNSNSGFTKIGSGLKNNIPEELFND